MKAVGDLAGQWETLAQNLGVKQGTIGTIKTNRMPGNAEMALNDAIVVWLKKNHATKFGMPSWRTLAKAVEPLDGDLARTIAKKYCKGMLVCRVP